jgi:ATP-binding cassette subfamily B protein
MAEDTPVATPVKRSPVDPRRLLSDSWWAVKLVWHTNASVTIGLVIVTLARGVIPAGLAIFARGIINACVDAINSSGADMSGVNFWVMIGFALTLLEGISQLAQNFLHRRLEDDINLAVTSKVLGHAATLDLAFFENARSRETIERAQQNIAIHISGFVLQGMNTITAALQAISLTLILAMIEPWVLALAVAFAYPYLVFQWRLTRGYYRNEHGRVTKRRWTNYFVAAVTDYRSVPEVRLLNLAPYLIRRFRELMTEFRDQDRALHVRGFVGSVILVGFMTVGLFFLFFRVVQGVFDGSLTLGDVAVFGGATARLRLALERAIGTLSSAIGQALYIANLRIFLAVKPSLTGGSRPMPAPARGEVKVEHVSFTYDGAAEPSVRDVTFHIRPGEIVGLVGENGAGKSTLIKLLCRLYEPTSGSIHFDGTDIRTVALDAYHREIAFVLQHFGRYEATAADNIAYGDWQRLLTDRGEVERIARAAGIEQLLRDLPSGYDTMIGRRFGTHDFSGGQWQRVAIARALARSASLLILDEPTASLDARAEFELFSRFRELAAGRTTLLVSHRFSTLSMADRILVMDEGQLVEQGTHDELIARKGLYATLYALHLNLLQTPRTDPSDAPSRTGAPA